MVLSILLLVTQTHHTNQTGVSMVNTTYAHHFHEVSTAVRGGMQDGSYPYGQAFASAQHKTGTLPNEDPVIMLTSNDHPGLSIDTEVLTAAQRVLQYGLSTCDARLHNGTALLHREFEQKLAEWLGFDDAVLFSSGFLANVVPLSAPGGPGVVHIADQLDHQSITTGCAQSGADLRVFPHNDPTKLEYILQRSQKYDCQLVVVDGAYFIDSDLAPCFRMLRKAWCTSRGVLVGHSGISSDTRQILPEGTGPAHHRATAARQRGAADTDRCLPSVRRPCRSGRCGAHRDPKAGSVSGRGSRMRRGPSRRPWSYAMRIHVAQLDGTPLIKVDRILLQKLNNHAAHRDLTHSTAA